MWLNADMKEKFDRFLVEIKDPLIYKASINEERFKAYIKKLVL